ncbi:YggT family protein [uncultured Prochlorococcus sp.]|uniref:YggT family protein n=1 Tax=Prochlorococcus sp. TaxID=1220 RepID=UPI000C3AA516|nr:YggT family protein [uncultured Prochlorococcus sp.]MAK08617.1 YggT family protein [Prochlorococcus sp. MED105]
MPQNYLNVLDLTLGILLSFLTLVFLIRLILTWYPKVDLNKGFWLFIAVPTSSILNLTRKLIPPIGGVDVGPVIWIGIISFIREILVGQQGLIKLAIQKGIN